MISLLPPARRSEIRYARRNFWLLRMCAVLCLVIFGIAIITGSGVLYLQRSERAYRQQIAKTSQSLEEQDLTAVQKEAEAITGNITLATNVLSKQVLFSKLLRQIGAAMPSNSSLNDLKITKGEQGVTLTAISVDYESATQVQVNLADPKNKIFSKADIISINCDKSGTRYPCTIVIRALFGDNTPYLFISPAKTKASS